VSHQSSIPETVVAAFSFNKNLHQAKLDWRFNQQFTDPRWATAYVGAELLAQQERAARRYDQQATALRVSVDEQTRQNADHARVLQTTIKESSDAVRREMTNVKDAVQGTTAAVAGLASQVAHLAWLQAEQNTTLRHVLETIREGRANECRQLVEQGERNFHAGYLADAEERFRLALGYDNTDYPTHQNLGLTLVGLGRLDEALEHFKKALAFPPKGNPRTSAFFVARAATHAARVLYAKGDYAGAEAYLREALEVDERSAKNWYDLAVVRTYRGNSEGAVDALSHAFNGDVLLAGAALSDEELEPIRPAIEALVLDQTERAMQTTVEEPAEALQRTNRRIAEIAREVGVDMQPVNVDEIVRTARRRGTLPATLEAFRALADERAALVTRTRDAIQKARLTAEHEMKEGLQSLDADRTTHNADLQPAAEALRTAAYKSMNPLAQFGLAILGLIVGAVIGGNISGCGGVAIGGGIGGLVGVAMYAALFHSSRAAAKTELDQVINTSKRVDAEMKADEAEIKAAGSARLKRIDAYLIELQNMRTSGSGIYAP
jgi:tetratricopeptide (TPR) repeat protein